MATKKAASTKSAKSTTATKASAKGAAKKSTSTKAASKKATSKKAASKASGKREMIDTGKNKMYARRDAEGQFTEMDDVGRSLAADRRRQAKTTVKPGYGDQGDQPRPSAKKSATKKTAGKTAAKKASGKKSATKK